MFNINNIQFVQRIITLEEDNKKEKRKLPAVKEPTYSAPNNSTANGIEINYYKPDFLKDFYNIQYDFMNCLYICISVSSIGLFESPTGTGKTLSIICAVLTWLLDNYNGNNDIKYKELVYRLTNGGTLFDVISNNNVSESKGSDDLTWVNEWVNDHPQQQNTKRQKNDCNSSYEFDFIDTESIEKICNDELIDCNSEDLLTVLNNTIVNKKKTSPKSLQILYSTRTISQISQVMNTVKNFCKDNTNKITALPLAARDKFCIKFNSENQKVSTVNNYCAEEISNNRCEYYKNFKEGKSKFINECVNKVIDIEDLINLGQRSSICPYYACREIIPYADLMVIPYPSLLNETIRSSLELPIKNNIIIIDEAHNLLDAISSANSVEISKSDVTDSLYRVQFYIKHRGSSTHLLNFKNFLDKISELFQTSKLYEINEFLEAINSSDFNFSDFLKWLEKEHVCSKIEKYYQIKNKSEDFNSSLFKIREFLCTLTNVNKDCKIFSANNKINSIMLNASSKFVDIISSARSVILVGGTMSPFDFYINSLFPSLNLNEIKKNNESQYRSFTESKESYSSSTEHKTKQNLLKDKSSIFSVITGSENFGHHLATFSCGHIIAKDNAKVFPIDTSKNIVSQNFSDLLDELRSSLCQIFDRIPYGCVAFFPSYKFLSKAKAYWKKLNIKSAIFWEDSDRVKTKEIWDNYCFTINKKKERAILFCVVGGKMSEGINFSDNLARGVIMIGQPYPDSHDPIFAEKMSYYNKYNRISEALFKKTICFRAINQAIGRAIRHVDDYAVIILLDKRYLHDVKESNFLPKWLYTKVENFSSFGTTLNQIEKFFDKKG